MRNLKCFSGSTSKFLEELVASKKRSRKDSNYPQRINILVPNIKVLYGDYELAHDTNNHVSLSPNGYRDQEKEDLLKLYTTQNPRLVKLRNSITTVLDNRAMNTCQYCTLAPIGSLDHIVPKGEFPEFAVNPKNLLPVCATCNSYKGENWRNVKTLFLNLYTNVLPTQQYLFVVLNVSRDVIEPTFELRNVNNIDVDFFEILESHYSKLHLPQRFKKESHKVISELTNLISASRTLLTRVQIIGVILAKIQDDKNAFGSNYYKSILEEALINNQNYMDLHFT